MNKIIVELNNELFFQLEGVPGETACAILTNFKDEADPSEAQDGYKDALDGMESLILSLYSAGIDVSTDQFKQAVQTSLYAIESHYAL